VFLSIAQVIILGAFIFGETVPNDSPNHSANTTQLIANCLENGWAPVSGSYEKVDGVSPSETDAYKQTFSNLSKASPLDDKVAAVQKAFKNIVQMKTALNIFVRYEKFQEIKNGSHQYTHHYEWVRAMSVILAQVTAMLATDGVAFAASLRLAANQPAPPPVHPPVPDRQTQNRFDVVIQGMIAINEQSMRAVNGNGGGGGRLDLVKEKDHHCCVLQ